MAQQVSRYDTVGLPENWTCDSYGKSISGEGSGDHDPTGWFTNGSGRPSAGQASRAGTDSVAAPPGDRPSSCAVGARRTLGQRGLLGPLTDLVRRCARGISAVHAGPDRAG